MSNFYRIIVIISCMLFFTAGCIQKPDLSKLQYINFAMPADVVIPAIPAAISGKIPTALVPDNMPVNLYDIKISPDNNKLFYTLSCSTGAIIGQTSYWTADLKTNKKYEIMNKNVAYNLDTKGYTGWIDNTNLFFYVDNAAVDNNKFLNINTDSSEQKILSDLSSYSINYESVLEKYGDNLYFKDLKSDNLIKVNMITGLSENIYTIPSKSRYDKLLDEKTLIIRKYPDINSSAVCYYEVNLDSKTIKDIKYAQNIYKMAGLSPDRKKIAFVDMGQEKTIKILDLETEKIIMEANEYIADSGKWINDQTYMYTKAKTVATSNTIIYDLISKKEKLNFETDSTNSADYVYYPQSNQLILNLYHRYPYGDKNQVWLIALKDFSKQVIKPPEKEHSFIIKTSDDKQLTIIIQNPYNKTEDIIVSSLDINTKEEKELLKIPQIGSL